MPKAFLRAYHFVNDEIWIINPSCKFLFWCSKSVQNEILGVLKKKVWKNFHSNFFSLKIEVKHFEITFFFKKFSYPIVLFDNKYELRMILAFICYAYCPYRCKIVIFQKLACKKLKNFGSKLNDFGINLQKKYGT